MNTMLFRHINLKLCLLIPPQIYWLWYSFIRRRYPTHIFLENLQCGTKFPARIPSTHQEFPTSWEISQDIWQSSTDWENSSELSHTTQCAHDAQPYYASSAFWLAFRRESFEAPELLVRNFAKMQWSTAYGRWCPIRFGLGCMETGLYQNQTVLNRIIMASAEQGDHCGVQS